MSAHYGVALGLPWGALLALVAVVVAAPTLCIAIAVSWRTRAKSRPTRPARGGGGSSVARALRRIGPQPWPTPDGHRRRARAGRLGGLAAGAVAGLGLVGSGRPELAPLAIAGGYLAGVVVSELSGWAPRRGSLRQASLRERRPAQLVPRWAGWSAVAATAVVVVAPVTFAVAPQVAYRPWRPSPHASGVLLPGGVLSWPGPDVTVPLAVVASGAVVLGALALRRIAGAPSVAEVPDPDLDWWRRQAAARAVSGAVVAIATLCLSATLLSASAALAVPGAPGSPAHLASVAMVWSGAALGVASLVAWLVLDGPPSSASAAGDPTGPGPVAPVGER